MVVPTRSNSLRSPGAGEARTENRVVLILSSDAMAAALVGGLVESLGYVVRFHRVPEEPDGALRRERPAIALVDCDDATLMKEDLLGRARMRGISVVMFGSADALRRMDRLAREHAMATLVMPVSVDVLDATLRRAVSSPAGAAPERTTG